MLKYPILWGQPIPSKTPQKRPFFGLPAIYTEKKRPFLGSFEAEVFDPFYKKYKFPPLLIDKFNIYARIL